MRGTNLRGSDRHSSGGGGAEGSGYVLADKVYDLSRALGTLRARSITNVEALRSVAEVRLSFFPVKLRGRGEDRRGGEGTPLLPSQDLILSVESQSLLQLLSSAFLSGMTYVGTYVPRHRGKDRQPYYASFLFYHT